MPEVRTRSGFRELARQFCKNRLAVASLIVVALLASLALVFSAFEFIPGLQLWLGLDDPNTTDVRNFLKSPCLGNPLGTDQLGRDVLLRMAYGARISLTVGFVAVALSVTIGVIVGAIGGYFGGWIDEVVTAFVEIMMCFPTFFLILTVVAMLGPSLWNIIIVMGLTGWTGTARLVRAEVLSVKARDYVTAARALGGGHMRLIFRHILPNSLTPALVSATLSVAGYILTEAGLSFLGFGVQPPQPTWGNILAHGRRYIFDAWWMTLFPGLAILITVLAFYLVGEGLRDALNPKLRRR